MKSILKYYFFKFLQYSCKTLSWLLNEGLIFTWAVVLYVIYQVNSGN